MFVLTIFIWYNGVLIEVFLNSHASTSAAILAVGSELLSGQVTNRNAAWLSAHLADHGIDTLRHVVVDDIEADIVRGIDALARDASLIILTGGLGPTSDDLTRNAVATWCDCELVYDAASWDHVVALFTRMNRAVPEGNRQQCFFPKGARVLTNRAGTANAFSIKAKDRELWILPGPPAEVEAIWQDFMDAALKERVPPHERKLLRMWRTIGRGESHLAEQVAPLLKDQGVDVAYRAHAPFVELKIRYPAVDAARYEPLCELITSTITPWLFEVDTQDVPKELTQRLASFGTVDIYDGATQGHLSELLSPSFRDSNGRSVVKMNTAFEAHTTPKATLTEWLENGTDADVALGLAGFDADGRWAIGIRINGERSVVEHALPYKGDGMRARNLKAIASLATKAWLTLLAGSLH